MTTIWFTVFYTPIQPLFPLISAICLFLNYWADKVIKYKLIYLFVNFSTVF